MIKNLKILIVVPLLLLAFACKDQWEERLTEKTKASELYIDEVINSNNQISKFYEYLKSTGFDSILNTPNIYTVYAPTNDAFANVPDSILNNPEKLKNLISIHITYSKFSFKNPKSTSKVKTIGGKYISLDYNSKKVENANLIEPYDIPAKNGIVHIIDKVIELTPNIWDFIESTDLCPKHVSYLKSLSQMVFDPAHAIQTGVDPFTGKPIYDTASGMVWYNKYVYKVRDLTNESLFSTLFLLTDDAFDHEYQKFYQFYIPKDSSQTENNTKFAICKDLVFPDKIMPDQLTDTLISMYNVKVPVKKSAIINTIYTSNGIIYVLNECDVKKEHKILPIKIEGEDTNRIVNKAIDGFNPYIREREGASGGFDFIMDNHKANPGSVYYKIPELCRVNYEIRWKAVNDFNFSYYSPKPDSTIKQKLSFLTVKRIRNNNIEFNTPTDLTVLIPVLDKSYATASETYLATLFYSSFNYYRDDIWLGITGSGKNTITLDYIILIPKFE
jgi:uncharacterized surface protein with fasciclin (FAS1) repeats